VHSKRYIFGKVKINVLKFGMKGVYDFYDNVPKDCAGFL
jgi:hypothetical protein